MKKSIFLLVFLMMFVLSGCDESDDKDFVETSAYEDYTTTYWGKDKAVDYTVHSYRMEYPLSKYLSGEEETLYNTLESIQEWLRVNDSVNIKNLIPYYDKSGNLTNFDIIFEPDMKIHEYKIALNTYNYNIGKYVTSMYVGNEKENGYYFIIYDKLDEGVKVESLVEPVETSKTVNEEIEEGTIEDVVETNTEDATNENVVDDSGN